MAEECQKALLPLNHPKSEIQFFHLYLVGIDSICFPLYETLKSFLESELLILSAISKGVIPLLYF